jgi:hypothetical protein
LHAFPLELACDRAEFDSGRRSVRKRLLGLGRVRVERPGDGSVVRERAQRLLGHRVDDVGSDQLGDLEHIGVTRILRPSTGPQRPLPFRTGALEGVAFRAGELGQVALVPDACGRQRHPAAQRGVGGELASTLVSIRDSKNDATEVIESSGSLACERARRPRRYASITCS